MSFYLQSLLTLTMNFCVNKQIKIFDPFPVTIHYKKQLQHKVPAYLPTTTLANRIILSFK